QPGAIALGGDTAARPGCWRFDRGRSAVRGLAARLSLPLTLAAAAAADGAARFAAAIRPRDARPQRHRWPGGRWLGVQARHPGPAAVRLLDLEIQRRGRRLPPLQILSGE